MLTQKGGPLAIDPKTGALFVGVGSSGNVGIEPEVKANIQRFEADGSGKPRLMNDGAPSRRSGWSAPE